MNQILAIRQISLLFVLISMVLPNVCLSQNEVPSPRATVSNDNFNYLYVNLDNPISVSVDGYLPGQIYVSSTTDCNLKGDSGSYTINPTYKMGQRKLDLNVYIIDKNKDTLFIEEKRFILLRIPNPRPYFGSSTGGYIGKGEMGLVKFISGRLDYMPYNLKHRVTSFKMVYQPNGGYSKSYIAKNHLFTPEMKKILENVKKGEKVMFVDIKIVSRQDGVIINETRKSDEILLIVK